MDASKILDAIENGAKLVVVDPVYTTTTAKADLWLPVEPGKDVHLALAMMHTVFEDETYDEDFLRKRTTAPALIPRTRGVPRGERRLRRRWRESGRRRRTW